jgi:uncharacterized protein (DUF924 family)
MYIGSLPHEEIENLWFGGLEFIEGEPFPKPAIQRWFGKSEAFDKKCRYIFRRLWADVRTYASLVEKITELPAVSLLALADTPEHSVTLILLLDQLSRNINRGTSATWAFNVSDPVALHVAHHCLRQDFDKHLPIEKKMWFYLALSHSEAMADQEMSVAKTATLANELRWCNWKKWHGFFEDMLRYAIKCYTTVDQFGRFPQRNAVLDRATTAEEAEFLKGGGFSSLGTAGSVFNECMYFL